MRSLLWLIVLFIVAVVIVLTGTHYNGNVFIVVEQTQIRINLHLFVGLVILLVVLLYVLLRIVMGLVHLPGQWTRWRVNHQRHQVETALNHAGLAFFEGRFQFAEREAERVLGNKQGHNSRALALMIAAHSADQIDELAKRDRYLNEIAQLPEKQQLSRYLLLARSALAKHDNVGAKNALEAASKISPNLTQVAKLRLRYEWENGNPQGVLQQVDKLSRADALSESELQSYRHWAYQQLLTRAHDPSELKMSLKAIPADEREGDLCVDIVKKYLQLGMYAQALKYVKKYYPVSFNPDLLPLFSEANQYSSVKDQQKSIEIAEKWLQQRPQDPALQMLLGQLSYDQQLWGKAKSYLEASLQISNNNVARLLLAKVLEHSGQTAAAQQQREQVLATISNEDEF
ncbi:heme biosynthesis protein HemY [Snodgrassella sp. B3882]|uniref:heme biosynthesis HemY N-terminal domain-containing protein n=1 Tax=Snodgrassella sp. B3882 TaxID=2818037 RepID=UPI00226A9A9B|nr:heme biosynthesis HemY N-terminal domain-containing protein [Snodgrassella sp. B3882]MCX8744518.1 heme biosynthesis protein HemY [Snodgrassella sp. B3882]